MLRARREKFIPFKRVLAFRSEEVDVILKHQLEDILLVDLIDFRIGLVYRVPQQWEAGQWEVVLKQKELIATL